MRWSALAVAALIVAGCTGNGAGDEGAQELAGNGTGLGTIEGIVVSQAIAPLSGVAVRLEPTGLEATTDSAGAFRFSGVAPGSYLLHAERAGYMAQETTVSTGQGLVRVVLLPDVGALRYVEVFVHDGFVEWSANVGGARTSNNDAPNFTFMGRLPEVIQVEMVWQSTQALGERMDLTLIANDGGAVLAQVGRAEGPSPIHVRLNATDIDAAGFGPEVQLDMAIFVGQEPVADGRGVGAAVQQRFTVLTHMFYGYAPPDGWRFSADGETPPP